MSCEDLRSPAVSSRQKMDEIDVSDQRNESDE
jgi:hypothetical protein